jgi:hypothetical protein
VSLTPTLSRKRERERCGATPPDDGIDARVEQARELLDRPME